MNTQDDSEGRCQDVCCRCRGQTGRGQKVQKRLQEQEIDLHIDNFN